MGFFIPTPSDSPRRFARVCPRSRCQVLPELDTTDDFASVVVTAPHCSADFDCSAAINLDNIFAFLSAWFAQSPAADFDGLGGIAVPDIFAFLSAWFAGC